MVESENFDVTVKTLDSQSRSYSVGAEITVKEFKEHISSSVGIPVEKQRLIYQGRVLQDEKKLKEYNVDGKVIHLVERAPPQTSPGTETSGPSGPGLSTPHGSTAPHHDRNANSYVMLGTLNLPVNVMDPQQIQHSVQQVMAGFGEAGSNARVSTSTGSNGSSVDVHIDMEQAIQSEPRMRLILAQNLLRDTTAVLNRLEGRQNSTHNSGSQASENPSTQTQPPPPPPPPSTGPGSEGAAEPMDTSTTAAPSAATSSSSSSSSSSFSFSFSSSSSSSSSTQTEGGAAAAGTSTGPNHPAPAEFLEVLSELRRVEDRLQPFIQRSQEILSTATSSDYNNNAQEREADQCILNLVGEALRLIGNAFVALSDLRCNLSAATPRHLHVVRPMSHYTSPVMLQQAGIPIQINLGTPVTMAANGRQAAEGQAAAGTTPEQQRTTEAQATPTHSQVPPSQPQATPTQPQAHHNHPRVIRITHHTMEPVVMMQMNIDDSGTGPAPSAAPGQGTGGLPQMQIPGLPAEFMQAIVHQITQQAVSMATAASSGQQVPGFQPPPARVVITRPTFTPRPPNMTPRPANINLRAQQPGQPGAQQQAGPVPNASLSQMISGLVGQLLQPVMMGQAGAAAPPSSGQGAPPSSSSSSSSSAPPSSSANTSGQTSTSTTSTASTGYPTPTAPPEAQHISQLLGSILGAGGAMGMPPSITVSMPGVPAFIQGMTDFMQAAQQVPGPPQSSDPQQTPPAPSAAPQQTAAPPPQQQAGAGAGAGGAAPESLSPEFFTSVVQGVLSSVMGSLGAQQDSTESIADFIQRLSSTSNIFEPGAGAATGFFGDLLSLICQNFSMVDMVMLLHGQFQPLQRIQPQLSGFFREQYLQGQEPTDANIRTASDNLINELEEHIIESFSSVSVREGVDITRTNLDFLREQFNRIATHILQCADHTFGLRLLELCNQGLFECLALNLYCLRGEQSALTAVINDRIRRMSADVNPSLVNWLTTIMGIRLQMILEHMPVTEEQILHYVRNTRSEAVPETAPEPLSEEMPEVMERETSASPVPATTAEEAMPSPEQPVSMGAQRAEPESEPWAATVPPEWVPIIRQDLQTQRKMKSQPPLSDAYLCGMPAKRRKTAQSDGPCPSLSEAVNRAARTVGAKPITSSESLQGDLDTPELQEAYTNQVKSDIQKRLQEDPEYSTQRFPNTHQVFDEES